MGLPESDHPPEISSPAEGRPTLVPPSAASQQGRRSLGFARSLGWVTLLLLIILAAVLSSYLGSSARKTLIDGQQRFATLLADYLNNQLYLRFTLPAVRNFGRIALSRPEQYYALDQIIQSITNGLQVDGLRIYAHDGTITYSTIPGEPGTQRSLPSVAAAAKAEDPIFDLEAGMPYWQAFFQFPVKANTFRLRTTYPLRIENRLGSSEEKGPLLGVLEFSQDISADIQNAIRFQQLVLVVTLFGCGILFTLLLLFIRRAERALADRMEQEQLLILELHQNEKLAGMGRVVAGIAHEIRNPLGIISSSAELLLKRYAGADSVTTRILQAIYEEARRLSRTVNDFLDYARPKQPRMGAVDIHTLISQALAFLAPDLTGRNIGVIRPQAHIACLVAGDKDLLYRAFYNILINSIQAMEHAGILTISLSFKNNMLEVSFRDTGPGFPAEHLQKVLDPFFTTKDDGTGLGLPIVNGILAVHGGTLTLSNDPAGGACVKVTLPRAEQSG
ncbi:MAG: two-component sensor histidine kinase [Desulfovibrio sp.]|jgi:signal transduction histidine kinase|nr:two-component sensor histidine kinase [Desulfovibrio sp.]